MSHARIGMVIIPTNNAKKVLSPGFAKKAEITKSIINAAMAIRLMMAMICLMFFFIGLFLSRAMIVIIIKEVFRECNHLVSKSFDFQGFLVYTTFI